MFDRYDRHDTTAVTYARSGPDGIQVLMVGGAVAALAIGIAMAMAAIAAMIWAVVFGGLGVAAIWGAVTINRDVQVTRRSANYRAVEELAGLLAAGQVPTVTTLGNGRRVIDAGTAPRPALPPGQVLVNGRPRDESASSARRW